MDFKKKYIKYKTKYLELKKYEGSGHHDDKKLPALERQISIDRPGDYINYIDFINDHKIIFNNTFIKHSFQSYISKGQIYLIKFYENEYEDKNILLKLSLHNYDPIRYNRVHIVKYEETNDVEDIKKCGQSIIDRSKEIERFDGICFKRSKYDYFSLNFHFYEDNKLQFFLTLKENKDREFSKNWKSNSDLINKFTSEIDEVIRKSFMQIVFYNKRVNPFFYELIRTELNNNKEFKYHGLNDDNYESLLNLLKKNRKISGYSGEYFWCVWLNLINQDVIDFSSLIVNNEIKQKKNKILREKISLEQIRINSFKEEFKEALISKYNFLRDVGNFDIKLKDREIKNVFQRNDHIERINRKHRKSTPIITAESYINQANLEHILPEEIYEEFFNTKAKAKPQKKVNTKYLKLKNDMFGGEIKEIPDNFYHVMSVTKAVIGILYHIHEKDYPRDKVLISFIKKDYFTNKIINKIITIGDALNMNSGLQNNKWNFDDFMDNVDDNNNLSEYSYNELNCAKNISRFDYNDLMYQMLASNLKDAAKKLAVFMNEPINEVMKEYIYFKKPDGEEYSGFFKEGNGWKWRHTENGEPTGPSGIWMTEEFALKFTNKVKAIVMKESNINRQKVPSFEEYDFIYNSQNVLKKYWNGWWFSNKCAYAIGHTFQCIAITPNGVRLQLYHEPNSKEGNEKAYGKEGELYGKLSFIDDIEKSLFDLKHLPGRNRSGLSKDDLVKNG